MNIWLVYQKHIEIEGEQLVAFVIADSEQSVREMLREQDKGVDPQYGRTDWLSPEVATCFNVGVANSDQNSQIIWFESIKHHLVYGRRRQLLDQLYTNMMQKACKEDAPE